jgi:four helix bundle protein
MQDFKHIVAYQRAHALSIALHRIVRPFGRAGQAHLKSQLTGAVEGIAATIVEGCGTSSPKEFARFLDMSIRSANETEHHLLFARDIGLLSPDDWRRLSAETTRDPQMIYGYRKKVLSRDRKEGLPREHRQHEPQQQDHSEQEHRQREHQKREQSQEE